MELEGLAQVAASPEVGPILRRAHVDRAERLSIAAAFAKAIEASREVEGLLRTLAENQRLGELVGVCERVRGLVDERLGRVRARLTSAASLTKKDRERICSRLESVTGKNVVPEVEVSAELIGGVVVEIGGRIFDGSVQARLARIRRSLAE